MPDADDTVFPFTRSATSRRSFRLNPIELIDTGLRSENRWFSILEWGYEETRSQVFATRNHDVELERVSRIDYMWANSELDT